MVLAWSSEQDWSQLHDDPKTLLIYFLLPSTLFSEDQLILASLGWKQGPEVKATEFLALYSFLASCLIVFMVWKFSGMSDRNLHYVTEACFFLIHIRLVISVTLLKLEVSYESLILPSLVFCSPGQIVSIPRVTDSSNLRARRISFTCLSAAYLYRHLFLHMSNFF